MMISPARLRNPIASATTIDAALNFLSSRGASVRRVWVEQAIEHLATRGVLIDPRLLAADTKPSLSSSSSSHSSSPPSAAPLSECGSRLWQLLLGTDLRDAAHYAPLFLAMRAQTAAAVGVAAAISASSQAEEEGLALSDIQMLHNAELKGLFLLQVDGVVDVTASRQRGDGPPPPPEPGGDKESINISYNNNCSSSRVKDSTNRVLKLFLTDGKADIIGFEFGRIPGLSSSTPRGTKVVVVDPWIRRGALVLTEASCRVIVLPRPSATAYAPPPTASSSSLYHTAAATVPTTAPSAVATVQPVAPHHDGAGTRTLPREAASGLSASAPVEDKGAVGAPRASGYMSAYMTVNSVEAYNRTYASVPENSKLSIPSDSLGATPTAPSKLSALAPQPGQVEATEAAMSYTAMQRKELGYARIAEEAQTRHALSYTESTARRGAAEAEVIELDSVFDFDSIDMPTDSHTRTLRGMPPQHTLESMTSRRPDLEDEDGLIIPPPVDLSDELIAEHPSVDEYGHIDDDAFGGTSTRGVFTYNDCATHYDVDQPAEVKEAEPVQLSRSILDDSSRDSLLRDIIAEFNRGVRKRWTAVLVTKGLSKFGASKGSVPLYHVRSLVVQGRATPGPERGEEGVVEVEGAQAEVQPEELPVSSEACTAFLGLSAGDYGAMAAAASSKLEARALKEQLCLRFQAFSGRFELAVDPSSAQLTILRLVKPLQTL